MDELETLTYERDGRVARITLNRPQRGNGITLEMPRELARCVERADLDPRVHVIALAGNGSGFCGGYDLVDSAETMGRAEGSNVPLGAPTDPATIAANHSTSEVAWRRSAGLNISMAETGLPDFKAMLIQYKRRFQSSFLAGGISWAACSNGSRPRRSRASLRIW